jgi:pimeloyl-ACP methyl ester carboxylesterase
VPGLNPAEQQPLHSELPTLVLSGEFDPITPPSYGDQAAPPELREPGELPGVAQGLPPVQVPAGASTT